MTLSNRVLTVSPRSVPVGQVRFVVRNTSTRSRTFVVVGKGQTRLIVAGGSATFATRFTLAGTKVLRSTTPALEAAVRKKATVSGAIRVVAPKRTTEAVADLGLTLIGKFNSPTFVVSPPGDTSRLLVVQQNGLVSLVKDGVVQPNPILDLRSVVLGEGEKGLLSIAFAPDYAASGLVYAYFNNRGEHQDRRASPLSLRSRLDRPHATPTAHFPDQADSRPQRRHDAVRARRLPLHRRR